MFKSLLCSFFPLIKKYWDVYFNYSSPSVSNILAFFLTSQGFFIQPILIHFISKMGTPCVSSSKCDRKTKFCLNKLVNDTTDGAILAAQCPMRHPYETATFGRDKIFYCTTQQVQNVLQNVQISLQCIRQILQIRALMTCMTLLLCSHQLP